MIKNEIIEYAKSIGIECIGFSDINFSSIFKERLIERKAAGHLSGFEESDENKRSNIQQLFENAKTIISVALPYRTCNVNMKKPYLSKSSLGIDYHRIVCDKLNKIALFLNEKYNAKSIFYSDIGPLSDREAAKKCGVGFYGKNTNIITEKYGSYVFLGELLTDIYIDRDNEIESKCGDCRLCIDACPAKAIEKPYYLNAKKCLSYLTQKKGLLTDEEMNKIGLRVYGCDVCQDVCPFNKNAELSNIDEFIPEDWNMNINPIQVLKMSNKQFNKTFGKTSSGWRGKKAFQRNLIIAMGNSRDKGYIPILKEMLENEDLKYYAEKAILKLEGDGNVKGT